MNILALDLGTTTGCAHVGEAGVISNWSWNLRGGRFEGGGMRYVRFEQHLAETARCAQDALQAIFFEEVRRHSGTDAAHVYGGLLAVLTAFAEKNHIPYIGVPVGTIKRHATGKGNASKDDMMIAAVDRGWDPADDNEADALWLLDYATHTYHTVGTK